MENPEPDDTDKPEECDSCYHRTTRLTRYEMAGPLHRLVERRPYWLCQFCESTLTGTFVPRHPTEYNDKYVRILQTICKCANILADVIRESRG